MNAPPAGAPAALLAVADELYALPLADFTPARDQRAKELKAADPGLAAQVKTLKKASLAAWVVNLLTRREAEQVAQIVAVGAALREAQESLDGEELRALTRQRRQLTAAVTTQARSLAAEEDVRVTQAVADQVEATLTAAMLDPAAAAAVRSGLLVAALAPTGLGEVDLTGALAVHGVEGVVATPRAAAPRPKPTLRVVPDPEANLKALRAAQEALAAADTALAKAERAAAQATAEVERLQAEALQVEAQIDETRRRLTDLEGRAEEIEDQIEEAQALAEEAVDDRDQAVQARDQAAQGIARLNR